MRVEELMSEAECCHPGDSIQDAAKLMKEVNVGFVPICDRDERPIGALTDRDIAVRVVAEGRSFADDVETVMTRDVVGCRIGDDLADVERQMRTRQTSRVMVCDEGGKLRGVVSLQDLAESESEHEAGQTLQDVKSDQPPALH
jgi:CBS domain-containing protein